MLADLRSGSLPSAKNLTAKFTNTSDRNQAACTSSMVKIEIKNKNERKDSLIKEKF
jgi:hypothetical protein